MDGCFDYPLATSHAKMKKRKRVMTNDSLQTSLFPNLRPPFLRNLHATRPSANNSTLLPTHINIVLLLRPERRVANEPYQGQHREVSPQAAPLPPTTSAKQKAHIPSNPSIPFQSGTYRFAANPAATTRYFAPASRLSAVFTRHLPSPSSNRASTTTLPKAVSLDTSSTRSTCSKYARSSRKSG